MRKWQTYVTCAKFAEAAAIAKANPFKPVTRDPSGVGWVVWSIGDIPADIVGSRAYIGIEDPDPCVSDSEEEDVTSEDDCEPNWSDYELEDFQYPEGYFDKSDSGDEVDWADRGPDSLEDYWQGDGYGSLSGYDGYLDGRD